MSGARGTSSPAGESRMITALQNGDIRFTPSEIAAFASRFLSGTTPERESPSRPATTKRRRPAGSIDVANGGGGGADRLVAFGEVIEGAELGRVAVELAHRGRASKVAGSADGGDGARAFGRGAGLGLDFRAEAHTSERCATQDHARSMIASR